jgi:hypothetical protein
VGLQPHLGRQRLGHHAARVHVHARQQLSSSAASAPPRRRHAQPALRRDRVESPRSLARTAEARGAHFLEVERDTTPFNSETSFEEKTQHRNNEKKKVGSCVRFSQPVQPVPPCDTASRSASIRSRRGDAGRSSGGAPSFCGGGASLDSFDRSRLANLLSTVTSVKTGSTASPRWRAVLAAWGLSLESLSHLAMAFATIAETSSARSISRCAGWFGGCEVWWRGALIAGELELGNSSPKSKVKRKTATTVNGSHSHRTNTMLPSQHRVPWGAAASTVKTLLLLLLVAAPPPTSAAAATSWGSGSCACLPEATLEGFFANVNWTTTSATERCKVRLRQHSTPRDGPTTPTPPPSCTLLYTPFCFLLAEGCSLLPLSHLPLP